MLLFQLLQSWSSIFFLIIVFVFVAALRRGKVKLPSGPTLVLRKFQINDRPGADVLLEIVGRPSGLTSWLLTVLSIDLETTLAVTPTEISIRGASLANTKRQFIPLAYLSSTNCGYHRSINSFILAIIFAGLTLLSMLYVFLLASDYERQNLMSNMVAVWLFGLLLSAGFFVAFLLSKKIVIGVETAGGNSAGVIFKRSVIENISIDLPEALRAIELLNRRVLTLQTLTGSAASRPATATPGISAPQSPQTAVAMAKCPKCASPVPLGSKFCDSCGARIP